MPAAEASGAGRPVAPIAIDSGGSRLLRLTPCAEQDLPSVEPGIPMPLALVVARSAAGVLMGLNRWREEWELPGGIIEPGESPREAAAREFLEETGLLAPALTPVAVATFELAPDGRIETAAVYRGELDSAGAPLDRADGDRPERDAEMLECRWWPGHGLEPLALLDAEIARRTAVPLGSEPGSEPAACDGC